MEVSSVNPVVSEREKKLKQVMSYSFAALDLGLYLNTHPHDKKALDMFSEIVKKTQEAREAFVKEFGPLTTYDCTGSDRWCWIDDPWPWDAQ